MEMIMGTSEFDLVAFGGVGQSAGDLIVEIVSTPV
jgi:hypothetical protein